MKSNRYSVLPFLLLSFLTILPFSTQALSSTDRTVVSYGTVGYSSLAIGRMMYQNWMVTATDRVAKTDLWDGHWDALSEVAAAKNVRPDFKGFLYINALIIYSDAPPGMLDTFRNNGWLLKDANGNYVTDGSGYWVDFGNPAVHQWYATFLKGYVEANNLYGVELDNTCVDTECFYFANSVGINPRTGSVWTDAQVCDAFISFVNTVKQALGPNRIVFGNGVYNGNHFYRPGKHEQILRLLADSQIDGIMSEGWVSQSSSADWYSEDMWLLSINFGTWLEDNFLSRNKVFVICADNAGLEWGGQLSDGTYPTNLPPGVTKDQYGTYVFASLLLVAQSGGEYINFGFYILESYPQSLFKIDLGNPLGAYSMISGTHIYVRDFSKAKVLVNPTYDSYKVSLDGNYETFDGISAVSPITVAPHTGMILKKL